MSDKTRPPPDSTQIIKINDGQFYRSRTASTMIDVAAIKDDIMRLQQLIEDRYALLAEGAAEGVADAVDAVTARKG